MNHMPSDVRTKLEAEMEADGGSDFKEWLADQFAHWAIDGAGFALGRTDASVRSYLQKALDTLYSIWDQIKNLLQHDYNDSAVRYINSVADTFRRDGKQTTDRSVDAGEVLNLDPNKVARAAQAKIKKLYTENPFAGAYRMVYTRLQTIDRRLANMFYQESNTKNRQGSSWQAITHYLTDRWTGKIETSLRRFKEAELIAGWEAIRKGDLSTPAARQLRKVIDGIEDDMRARFNYHSRKNFVPEAFSHEAIAERRDEFDALIKEHFKDEISDEQRRVMVDSILFSDTITDLSVAPGKAVSQHANVDRLLANEAFVAAVNDAKFLLTNPNAILHQLAQSAAKRTAWEQKFGGYVDVKYIDSARMRMLAQAHVDLKKIDTDAKAQRVAEQMGLEKDGKLYSPNAKLNAELERIREAKGQQAAIDARKLIRNAMGLDGHNMPEKLRGAQNWLMTFLNYTVLAFSGVASIPEMAGASIRGAGRVSIKDTFEVMREFKQHKHAAEDLGIVMSDMAEKAMLESMGPEYQSPLQHKLNYWLFKYNGQQAVMRTARTMAVGLGKRYLVRTAQAATKGDKRALEELAQLNVSLPAVQRWMQNGQRGTEAVDQALNQFVYESVIQPSRFEATTWGNNPWMKLAWHLKQFLYSYTNVLLLGVWRGMGGRWDSKRVQGSGVISATAFAAVPGIVALGLIIPMAMGAQELREWIQMKDRTARMDESEYMTLLASKAGFAGPMDIIFRLMQAQEWGKSPILSLTTVGGKAEQLLDLGSDGELSAHELENKVRLLTPFFAQNKEAWNYLFR